MVYISRFSGFHPILLTEMFGFLLTVHSHFQQRVGARGTWYNRENVEAAFSNMIIQMWRDMQLRRNGVRRYSNEGREQVTQSDVTLTRQIKDRRASNISFGNQVNCYKVKSEEDCGNNRTGFQPSHLRTLPRGSIQVLVQNTRPGSVNESVQDSSGLCLSLNISTQPWSLRMSLRFQQSSSKRTNLLSLGYLSILPTHWV